MDEGTFLLNFQKFFKKLFTFRRICYVSKWNYWRKKGKIKNFAKIRLFPSGNTKNFFLSLFLRGVWGDLLSLSLKIANFFCVFSSRALIRKNAKKCAPQTAFPLRFSASCTKNQNNSTLTVKLFLKKNFFPRIFAFF